MSERIYIDCHASIGMHGPTDARIPWKKEQLLADMEHTGIHASLVWHWSAREYDPGWGNNHLMQEIGQSPRLLPCWVVLPHHSGEMPKPVDLLAQMQAQNVHAVKLFPQRHHYSFSPEVCGALAGALSRAEIPLLIDVGIYGDDFQSSYDDVWQLCAAFPDLIVILQKARWESTRKVMPLLNRHENIYIEFSSYQIHYGLEYLSKRIGAKRLLLGTEWPFKSPGAARAFIDYCELSEKDKDLVAGKNLARLLKLKSMPEPYAEKQEDDLVLAAVKQGKPLDHIPVIDPHTHVLHDGLMGSGYITIPHGDAEHMIRRNRRLGIDRFCCSSWIGIWIDYREGNRLIHELCERYPEDIIGYATIDPKKSDDYAADIKLCHETYGFHGIKPYNPRVGLPYNSPLYDAWYAAGNTQGAFVKLHQTSIGDNYLEEIADISERYPNMNYLLAHSAWTWEVAHSRVKLAQERDNIYLDLTFTSILHGVVEYFVEQGLAHKVLFCTDAPMRDPIQQLAWVAYARISEQDKEQILGGNSLRMLAQAGYPVEQITKHYPNLRH